MRAKKRTVEAETCRGTATERHPLRLLISPAQSARFHYPGPRRNGADGGVQLIGNRGHRAHSASLGSRCSAINLSIRSTAPGDGDAAQGCLGMYAHSRRMRGHLRCHFPKEFDQTVTACLAAWMAQGLPVVAPPDRVAGRGQGVVIRRNGRSDGATASSGWHRRGD
jgi:hypothetical protein